MKKILLFLIVYILTINCFSQNRFFSYADSISKKRVAITSTSIATSWAGGTIGLYSIWYKNYANSKFHLFNDENEWLQMDKIGHIYTTNKLAYQLTDFYKWSGISSRKAAVIGTSIGFGFQTTLEIMDGKSTGWGFSISDMAANTIGGLAFMSQEFFLNDQYFILKFSDHQTKYAQLRPNVLGSTFSERLLKDYNGQTYWISFNPTRFLKISRFPKWICLSIGYSIDQKIIGNDNYFTDPISLTKYEAKRELLLSLDVDFSKLNIKRPWIKAIVKQFNYIKIPFPSIIFSNGSIQAKGMYF